MLFRNTRLLHSTAITLLFQIALQLLAPTVSYALTSGPTAPEATNFEPVDTTDMVNTLTGDFTYNTPLLEVPGPEGGYPLSLSYHAGIQPNEEASWVGLGWSLNPGSIARNVSGYADDQEAETHTTHDYWEGGVRKTYTASLGLSASVSANLSHSQDTYQGFSAGGSLTTGPLTIGTDGRGNNYAAAGLELGSIQALNVTSSTSAQVSTNFKSVDYGLSTSTSVGIVGQGFLGATLSSTNGSKYALTALGHTKNTQNDNAGRIQTKGNNFKIPLPTPYGIVTLGYAYQRYWSDEKSNVEVNGSLYVPKSYVQSATGGSNFVNKEYDTYRLLESGPKMMTQPDADYHMGGSFPNYDNYSVVAQGLSGSMRPYAFQQALYSRNRIKSEDFQLANQTTIKINKGLIVSSPLPWTNRELSFRFQNDFSNQYTQTSGTAWLSNNNVQYPFSASPSYGNPSTDAGSSITSYNAANNRLAGSRHIEHYTNAQILSGNAKSNGFIDGNSLGFERTSDSRIGGFKITNESGMTYHFALPAYSYNERVYTKRVDPSDPNPSFNNLKKPSKYAYTWYLTAVTGPDYVDQNNNGTADAEDWGYWVGFDYGLWVTNYTWRNPSEGFNSDVDGSYQTFSIGQKELYYLNAIRTRTHTAIFEKEIRSDGKSCSQPLTDNSNSATYGITSSIINNITTFDYPKTQLRLNRILLFKNGDLPASLATMAARATNYDVDSHRTTYASLNDRLSEADTRTNSSSTKRWNGLRQWGQFVLDKYDVAGYATLQDKSIRTIEMKYDYSLTPGVTNGFTGRFSGGAFFENNPNDALPQVPGDLTSISKKTGKLTLNALQFAGAGGISMIPPTRFNYGLEPQERKSSTISIVSSATTPNGSINGVISVPAPMVYEAGTVLQVTGTTGTAYCTVLGIQSASTTNYNVRFFTSTLPQGALSAEVTKNPPYLAEYYDSWGLFKSDFNPVFSGSSLGEARKTTEASGRASDAWSLRSISTPLGATIKVSYGSDEYDHPSIAKPGGLTDVSGYALDDTHGVLMVKFTEAQTRELFKVGGQINVSGFGVTPLNSCSSQFVTDVQNARLAITAIGPWQKRLLSGSTILAGTLITVYDPNHNFFGGHNGEGCRTPYGVDPLMLGHIQLVSSPTTTTTKSVLYGGGIRVTKLALATNEGVHETTYNYNRGDKSSGTTPYDPYPFYIINSQAIDKAKKDFSGYRNLDQAIAGYTSYYAYYLADFFSYVREIPAPGVMYEFVTVRQSVSHPTSPTVEIPGSAVYQYEVFKPNMIGRDEDVPFASIGTTDYNGATGNQPTYVRSITLKDFTDRVGNLKKVTKYDARGNKLSETKNHFLHDELADANYETNSANYAALLSGFHNQGVVQECFGDSRDITIDDGLNYQRKVVMSRRASYPAILTGSSTTDYLTNQTTTSQTAGFDFYSGVINKSVTTDGYGNRFLTEVTPAYRKYPAMGLKTVSSDNRHMLTQQASTATYRVNSSNSPIGVMAASVNTWSNSIMITGTDPTQPETRTNQNVQQQKIWRPFKTYAWMPNGSTSNGLTPANEFAPFDFVAGVGPSAAWRKTGEVTLYNPFSSALEAKDINSNFVATKMGYGSSRVLISGAPANYTEIAYSGAEDELIQPGLFSNGIRTVWPSWATGDTKVFTDATGTTGKTHTGTRSLQVFPQKHGFSYDINPASINPTKAYRASMWASKPVAQLYYWVDGVERSIVGGTTGMQANGWYLINLNIPAIGWGHSTFRIGCYNSSPTDAEVYVDDFRFQPANAQATSYVYDQSSGQVTDVLDNNNLFTHYGYDVVGRLVNIKRETLAFGSKLVGSTSYSYGTMPFAILDNASLSINQQPLSGQAMEFGINQGLTAKIDIPYQQAASYTILYNTGEASTYTPSNGFAFTCAYSTTGTYWLKIRIKDAMGNQRDLAQKILIR